MASPIDGVIEELQRLVANTLSGPIAPSRIGYFASLYLRVTCTIRERMGTGYFDDDARMERLAGQSSLLVVQQLPPARPP